MSTLLEFLGVFALGVVELWAAVPAGIALGLPPSLVWLATLCGALVSIAVVVLAGESLRSWIVGRMGHGPDREGGPVRRVWERYGVVGWGLVGPLLVGAPLSAALAVSFGAPRRRLLLWLSAGAVLWTTVLTVAVVLGVDVARDLT